MTKERKESDRQALAATHKQMRQTLTGIEVNGLYPHKDGRVVEVEVLETILDLDVNDLVRYNDHVICHVWTGKELWQAKASELIAKKETSKLIS